MKVFWIIFSVFFIIASVVGVLTIIHWIVEAIKHNKINNATKKEISKQNTNDKNNNQC